MKHSRFGNSRLDFFGRSEQRSALAGCPLRWAGDRFCFKDCLTLCWCGSKARGESEIIGGLDDAMTTSRVGLLSLIVGLLPGWLAADEPGRRAVDYIRDVKPVLSKRCYACHGALKQKAGLRLDTAAFMKKGGDSGPAIEPGSSDDSLIIEPSPARGWRMPPESEGAPLSADEISRIKAWIDQGAKSPADEAPQPDPQAALVVSAAGASEGSIRG